MLFSSTITRFFLAGSLPSAILFFFKDDPVFQSGEKFLKVVLSVYLFNMISPYPETYSGFRNVSLSCTCLFLVMQLLILKRDLTLCN